MRTSERTDWRRYRAVWGDVLQDAAEALGCLRALQLLLQPLSDMVAPKPFDWVTAELAMHCVRCVCVCVLVLVRTAMAAAASKAEANGLGAAGCQACAHMCRCTTSSRDTAATSALLHFPAAMIVAGVAHSPLPHLHPKTTQHIPC